MTWDGRRQTRATLVLRLIRPAALMIGLARAQLGPTWSESESAKAALLDLVYGVEAGEGYLCKDGRS